MVGTLKFKVSAFETSEESLCMISLPLSRKLLEEKRWKTLKKLAKYMNDHLDKVKEDEEN